MSTRPVRPAPEGLTVPAAGRLCVVEGPSHFVIRDDAGVEVEPVTDWLLQLTASDMSVNTLRAYALSTLRYFRFLWAMGLSWDQATDRDVRDFVIWARSASKHVGRKRSAGARTTVNLVTGKRYQTKHYSPRTINHTLTVVSQFYSYHLDRGRGPVRNPIPGPRGGGRLYAHQGFDEPFEPHRRAALRQKEIERTPRAIPDAKFDELFRRLNNNRDRALFAFYVSSGVRASELLGLTGEMINYGDQLIGVIRKGRVLQWVPASPDAFVWLRLYQLERGVARSGQPVWLTRREPFNPLSYDAFRAVINRANAVLGSNWSAHDLRHTFSIRALDGGMYLTSLQEILGHQSLLTTAIYTKPRPDDVIAHHRAIFGPRGVTDEGPKTVYNEDDLKTLFGWADQGQP